MTDEEVQWMSDRAEMGDATPNMVKELVKFIALQRDTIPAQRMLQRNEWAGMALQGLLANQGNGLYNEFEDLNLSAQNRSYQAFVYADAMIAASQRPPEKEGT